MSWLGEQVALLRAFLRTDYRRMLGFCALGMLGAVVLGTVIGLAAPEVVLKTLDAFMAQMEQTGVVDEGGNFSVFVLLMNNWRAMLLSAAYGFIPFLFLPLVSLLTNGLLLGLLASLFLSSGALLPYLAGILPHGIFEIPAIVLSIACGMLLCRNMCRLVTGSPKRQPMVELLGDLLRVILLLVMPLTVAAAVVECYVTPLAMGLFV